MRLISIGVAAVCVFGFMTFPAGRANASPVQVAVWDPVQAVPAGCDVGGLRLDLPYGDNRDVTGLDLGFFNRVTRDFTGIEFGLIANRAGLFALTNEADRAQVQAAGETHEVRDLLVMRRHYLAAGDARGIQLAGGVNQAVDLTGLQAAGLANIAVDVHGGQFGGLMNVAHRNVNGFQMGLFGNLASGNVTGWQTGLLGNQCRGRLLGVQLAGLFNEAAWMKGIQAQGFFVGGNRAGTIQGVQVCVALLPGNQAQKMDGFQVAPVFNSAEEIHGVQLALVNYAKRMTGLQVGLINIIRESSMPFFPFVHASF